METGHRVVAVTMGLIGLTALVSLEEIAFLFVGLSVDRTVHPYSWLQLEIALGGLLGPAVALFWWPTWLALGRRLGRYLEALSLTRFMALTLSIGLLVRIAAVLLFDLSIVSDAAEYDRLGWNLAQSGCYCEDGVATAYRAPGYPFFLSLVYRVAGHNPSAVVWLQTVVGAAVIWLLYSVARRLQFSEPVARLAALGTSLFPGLILYTNQLLSEVLFVALLLAGLRLCLSNHLVVVLSGGVVMGLAALTRPIGALIPLVLIGWWWWRTRSVSVTGVHTVVVLVGLVVILLPWMVRNKAELDRFTLVTSGGVNFYIGNNQSAGFGYQSPDSLRFDLTDPRREASNDRRGYELGLAYIRENPVTTLTRAVAKVAYLYAYDVDPLGESLLRAESTSGLALKALAVAAQAFYLTILLLALRGLWQIRSEPRLWMVPLGLAILVTAVSVVTFAAGRFHVPVLPMAALAAAVGLLRGEPE